MIILLISILVIIDLYAYQALDKLLGEGVLSKILRWGYWGFTIVTILFVLVFQFGGPEKFGPNVRGLMLLYFLGNYASKLAAIIFVFIDDGRRAVKWAKRALTKKEPVHADGEVISRSDFLMKSALVGASVPLASMGFGIISGAHDYRIKRQKLVLPNLPKSFDGITIGQISDIHSGSFFNKTAVLGGVEMFMAEKPDLVFFTGDLVNNRAEEVKGYIDIFGRVKAPLGVYSILGNHDYGDYSRWPSLNAKRKNLEAVIQAHQLIGWDILLNENRIIERNGDKLAIIGNENWGAGRFSKYGRLAEAYMGAEDADVKLLLSHDPSHWDAQVRTQYPDIDVMFAGHTHGFQFGVEIGDYKWSPAQYIYKQWAGLYSEGAQHLYVNRGFGYLAFPGRIGMPPEITILELSRT